VPKDAAFVARAALDLHDVLGVGLFSTQETRIRSQSSKVAQPQTDPSETRSVLAQHKNNALAAVPVLEAYINCKCVVSIVMKKSVLSTADQSVREREKTCCRCADRGGLTLLHTNSRKLGEKNCNKYRVFHNYVASRSLVKRAQICEYPYIIQTYLRQCVISKLFPLFHISGYVIEFMLNLHLYV
jgi:hypothetical protein